MVLAKEAHRQNYTARKREQKALICKGVYLFVKDDETVAVVTELTTDNLAFTAVYLDTGYDRALMYSGTNWRKATQEEVEKARRNDTKWW